MNCSPALAPLMLFPALFRNSFSNRFVFLFQIAPARKAAQFPFKADHSCSLSAMVPKHSCAINRQPALGQESASREAHQQGLEKYHGVVAGDALSRPGALCSSTVAPWIH